MSIGLTTAELSSIRTAINDLLPGTCNILSCTSISDGEGGYSETWGTASSNVACRIDPIRGKEQVAAGAVQAFYQHVLTLPYNATLDESKRIEIGTALYSVISVDYGKSWNASTRAIVERLTDV